MTRQIELLAVRHASKTEQDQRAFLELCDHGHQSRLHPPGTQSPRESQQSYHPATGGYLTIENHGNTADVLIGVSADFAMKSKIHEIRMEGDEMKMRPLESGLVIPENEEIHLKPGGYHLMFINSNSR